LARLVVVSNRVALPTGDGANRAGGLEVAVRAALRRQSGIWFGWSGKIAPLGNVTTQTITHDDLTFVVTDLTKEDHQEYYSGFANGVLWPVLHYRLDLAEFSRRALTGYLRVNEHFAAELHKILLPEDVIWVHDYHLMPLAKALRDRGHDNKIGFFLHIPLPPPDILTALPSHERLIGALSHYDLVGFQTESDVENFGRYLTKEAHLPSRDQRTFTVGDRTLRIGAFPVGIETAEFGRLARRALRSTFVREVLGSMADRAMIIGVDRLDYSKGLPLRMEAFEHFLETYPDWRGKVTYLQITPKSRSDIREYMDIDQAVGSAAGRINGTYGEASWTPIRYVNRAHSRTALAGLYRAARAALVTPLRDGMNLVAKEYVASQDPENPGVLILSRFAGAAVELDAALLVNPYDSESVAAAIAQALAMPLDERKARHEVMLHALAASDLKFWADRFLGALTRPRPLPNWLRQVSSLVAM
jgi:trehalose 6-phosphate synthase